MYDASGDGILEPKEFQKWAKRNYTKFFNIFEKKLSFLSKLLQNPIKLIFISFVVGFIQYLILNTCYWVLSL